MYRLSIILNRVFGVYSLSLSVSFAYCANLSLPLKLRFLLLSFLYCFCTPFFSLPVSDSLRSDSSLLMLYSNIFFFSFSLHVKRLLSFGRGQCTTKCPLLAGSSSDLSFWLNLSFGPLSRNEIRLSSTVPESSSSSSWIVSGSLASILIGIDHCFIRPQPNCRFMHKEQTGNANTQKSWDTGYNVENPQ